MVDRKSVVEFYDNFSDSQIKMGINSRHLSIQRWLEDLGLKRNHNVLEVGCGIGTLSDLILTYLNSDSNYLGVDISSKSIKIAEKHLARFKNTRFETIDFTKEELEREFDVIVLPDVIEHIPIDLHSKLFSNLSKSLSSDGFMVINIPHPDYLQYCIDKEMPGLQIIDQPVHTEILANALSSSGLHIDFLSSYSVFIKPFDYQILRIRRIPNAVDYRSITPKKEAFFRRLDRRIRSFTKLKL